MKQKNTSEVWSSKVQKATWDYTLSLWRHRNAQVHGTMDADRYRIQANNLRGQVQVILNNPPLMGVSDQYLLKLGYILNKRYRAQKD